MVAASSPDILLAGGLHDPNLQSIHKVALSRALSVLDLRHGPNHEPELVWDLQKQTLIVNGIQVRPRSAFTRWNVFQSQSVTGPSGRDDAWHGAITAYLHLNSQINWLNRDMSSMTSLKVPMLAQAKAVGLEIPQTQITNNMLDYQARPFDFTAKPICGGSQTICLSNTISELPDHEWIKPSPAIIQTKLSDPEYRAFLIQDRLFVFEIGSGHLDYRGDQNASIKLLPPSKVPEDVAAKLRKLTRRLRVDFCTCQFKINRETGNWVFLELNNAPMFAAFDEFCSAQISNAIVDSLCIDTAGIDQRDPMSQLLQLRGIDRRCPD